MATRTAVKQDNFQAGFAVIWLWENLTDTGTVDTGSAVPVADVRDIGIQAIGDFDASGDIHVEGSIDGTTWARLNDPQGDPISLTAAGIVQVQENVAWIRPKLNAGTGVDIDVWLVGT